MIEETTIQEVPVERDMREKNFEDKLCEELDFFDRQYERQKRVENGIIDIFVYDRIPMIIEVKRSGTLPNIMQAIVQLKFYEACFKKADLYISVPEGINPRFLSILKQFGIFEHPYAGMTHVTQEGDRAPIKGLEPVPAGELP